MSANIAVRPAVVADVDDLTRVVNSAYRDSGGWTTDAHMVGGVRATKEDFTTWLSDPVIVENGPVFVAEYDGKIAGCIQACLEGQRQSDTTHDSKVLISDQESAQGVTEGEGHPKSSSRTALFQLFGVLPSFQSKGIGKALVLAALDHIKDVWKCDKCRILIFEQRPELQSWYERFGFTWDGETEDFVAPELLKIPNIKMRCLTKRFLE